MRSVEVRVIDGAPERAEHAPLALGGHVHLPRQALAHQQGLLGQLLVSREASLALGFVLTVLAVGQREPGSVGRLCQVHVVLLSFLERLHVHIQVLSPPVVCR